MPINDASIFIPKAKSGIKATEVVIKCILLNK